MWQMQHLTTPSDIYKIIHHKDNQLEDQMHNLLALSWGHMIQAQFTMSNTHTNNALYPARLHQHGHTNTRMQLCMTTVTYIWHP
jgi:hypothetical protein